MRSIIPSPCHFLVSWVCVAGMFFGQARSAVAQEPAPVVALPAGGPLTAESVKARIAVVEASKDLDAALRTRLVEVYGKIEEQVRAAADAQARSERFTKLVEEAPKTLEELQCELNEPLPDLEPDPPREASLTQAQQHLTQAEGTLAQIQAELKTLQDEAKRRGDRRIEIPKLGDAQKLQLQELNQQLEAKPPADDSKDIAFAGRLLLEARKAALTAELPALLAESRYYEVSGDQLPLQRDQAARRVAQREAQVKRLRDNVNTRRQTEADKQAREARRVAAHAHPALKPVADRNAELARLRQALADKIASSVRELEHSDRRVGDLDSQFEKIRKRVEMGGRLNAIGLLLRKHRDELPNVSRERAKIQSRATEMADLSLQLVDYEDERNLLATLDQRMAEILAGLDPAMAPEERTFLETELRDVLQTQRDYLDAIIGDTNSCLDKLVEQDLREQQLISKTEQYAEFCDERILWIRSAPALGWTTVRESIASTRWFADAGQWRELLDTLQQSLVAQPWTWALGGAAWLGGLVAGSALRRRLIGFGEQASRGSCRTIIPTLRALVLSAMLASPWPLLVACIGLHLTLSEGTPEFARALGRGLLPVAVTVGALEFLRQVCRRHGLGHAHFGWNDASLRLTQQMLLFALVCGVPLAYAVHVCEAQSNEVVKNSLGRLAFVLLMMVLGGALCRLSLPESGVLAPAYQQEPTAWWTRGRWAWPALAVGTPLALAGLALGGYYYTALQLASYSLATAWLIIGLVIAYGLLLRWSLVAYRSLGMQRLQERRAAAEAAGTSTPVATNAPLEIKLADINQRTQRTLQLVLGAGLAVGTAWIWVKVFPALGVLRRIELWSIETVSPSGGAPVTTAVTLADLLLSVLALALTVTLGRNVPSLLELTVLKQLPLDAGARYAVGTVARYVITGAGIALAFATLGLEWSQVQWLVAAISVGLGFGLQDIFANFVSGLMLLFERPIRIGDVVTVGDVTGKVSNIRIRSTTITDWDMRELVVPNKEFITSRVVNWTLSTKVSRMSIRVGVAHGTPPDQVRSILLDVAQQHPLVLKDPASHALLDDFGESSLGFVLRVHMATLDNFIQLRHELMTDIALRFQAAGIEIAFPQRDIHVRLDDLSAQRAADFVHARRTKSA